MQILYKEHIFKTKFGKKFQYKIGKFVLKLVFFLIHVHILENTVHYIGLTDQMAGKLLIPLAASTSTE